MSTSAKDAFLSSYEREHATTMKVLRAFPPDRIDLRPHPRLKTAKELAWVFAMERMLGTAVLNDALMRLMQGATPPPPQEWEDVLAQVEQTHRDFGDLVRALPDDRLRETVKFFTGPGTIGDVPRIDFCWFLLFDEIHHRGQFSVYLRLADGKVPSIYGPSGDEPWR